MQTFMISRVPAQSKGRADALKQKGFAKNDGFFLTIYQAIIYLPNQADLGTAVHHRSRLVDRWDCYSSGWITLVM